MRFRVSASTKCAATKRLAPGLVRKYLSFRVDTATVTPGSAPGLILEQPNDTPDASRRWRASASNMESPQTVTSSAGRPRRAAAIAVMAAPPPGELAKASVLISSPSFGNALRPKKTKSMKNSPAQTSCSAFVGAAIEGVGAALTCSLADQASGRAIPH